MPPRAQDHLARLRGRRAKSAAVAGRRVLVGLRTVLIVGLFIGWQLWWCWELLRFVPPSDYPP